MVDNDVARVITRNSLHLLRHQKLYAVDGKSDGKGIHFNHAGLGGLLMIEWE